MNLPRSRATCAALVALAGFALGSLARTAAARQTFNDEASFRAAAGVLSLESFEGQTATNTRLLTTLALPSFTMRMSPDHELGVFDQPDFFGAHATHGTKHVCFEDGFAFVDFQFNEPVRSFGINVTDFGDFGSGSLSFTNSAGANHLIAAAPRPDGNELFFGLIANVPFNSARVSQSIVGELVGVDEIYVGLVPEPGTAGAILAMLAACAIGRLAARRRRG